MPVPANPQTSQVSVDPYVRKIASVCDMHGVTVGCPANLAGFMGALDENKHLAMDFWAILARMSDERSGQSAGPSSGASNGRMLAAIVEGVTGRSVAEVAAGGSEQGQLVGRLVSMLAGEDVGSPVAEAENLLSVNARSAGGAGRSEFAAVRPPLPPRTLVPLSAPVLQQPESTPVRRSDESLGVPEPEPLPPPGASVPKDDPTSRLKRYVRTLQERYGEIGRDRRAIFVGLLLLVAAGSGIFSGAFFAQGGGYALWQRYGGPVRARYSAAARQIQDNFGEKKSYQFANFKGGDYSASDRTSGARAPVPATKQPGGAAGPKSFAVRKHEAVRVSEAYSSSSSIASSNGSGAEAPVAVDPAVMKANLISLRVPAYPEAARANHVEGRVVMQAIVSKDGTVGHLRAVDGDPVLRHAVYEAVLKWRYLPYMVNGEPVEVGTTVTVDFILGQ
jgi:TonB family protein